MNSFEVQLTIIFIFFLINLLVICSVKCQKLVKKMPITSHLKGDIFKCLVLFNQQSKAQRYLVHNRRRLYSHLKSWNQEMINPIVPDCFFQLMTD